MKGLCGSASFPSLLFQSNEACPFVPGIVQGSLKKGLIKVTFPVIHYGK